MCKLMISALTGAVCMFAAAFAQAAPRDVDRPVMLAQAGITFGSRDDLGPRYEPYSERWDRYKPPDIHVCRWMAVRTVLPNGEVVLRQHRICGFRVPARQ